MNDNLILPIPAPREATNMPDTELETLRTEVAELRRELASCSQHKLEQAKQHRLAGEEIQHRARNTMALVRSAFRRTIEIGRSLEDVEMHFCGRLDVLARYMLPRSDRWNATVDVENIIREELRSFEFGDAPGIGIEGPPAGLSLEQTQSFALMIHELATNALKFGALSVPNAVLSVTWDIRDGWLKLVWAEAGVPIVLSAPLPRGFGQELIEEAIPYQIGAVTQFEHKPGGICCTIEVQLPPQAVNS